MQIYVNQHDFFISKDRVLEDAQKLVESNDAGGDDPSKADMYVVLCSNSVAVLICYFVAGPRSAIQIHHLLPPSQA